MPSKTYNFLYVYYLCLFCTINYHSTLAKKELKLLNVVSHNQFYIPDYNVSSADLTLPKNLTYEYYTEHAVNIPNSIKMQLFNTGAYLREMYDKFLGSFFYENVAETRTAGYPASIIAGELVNSGLWPPVREQIWNEDFFWQPIPFVYEKVQEDTVLLGTLCPNFQRETTKVLENYNLTEAQEELLAFINNEGHVNVTNPIDAALLYLALQNSHELGQRQPDWSTKIFPSEIMLNLSLTAYDLLGQTIVQKQLNGGTMIKAILRNFNDFVVETEHRRKITIYSGDDRNFAGLLKNLNVSLYEIPKAGAALIFELYAEEKNHYIKIDYYTGTGKEAIPQTLAGCDFFCPIDKFSEIVSGALPGDDDEASLCGYRANENPTDDIEGMQRSIGTNVHWSQSLLILSSLITYLYNILPSYHEREYKVLNNND